MQTASSLATKKPTSFRAYLVLAILALLVGTGLTIQGALANQQVDSLTSHGVAVQYHVSTCQSGYRESLTCMGSFTFDGTTYTEDLSGVVNAPNDGVTLPALINASEPGAYVYARSAIVGANAIGVSPYFVGGIAVLVLAGAFAVLGVRAFLRRRRTASPSAGVAS